MIKNQTILAACTSFESNNGHLFLSIEYFQKNNFFSVNNKKIIKKILFILNTNQINWFFELSKHHAVSNGDITTPLVLFQKKIYLYKIWKSEKNILKYLYQKKIYFEFDLMTTCEILKKLFPSKEYNAQKTAVALRGPGTGKTTVIIKIIIALIKNTKKNIKIQLSAPTGKATTRLIEILNNHKIFDLYISSEEKKLFILPPVTIHQLLGISKTSDKIFFNKKNPLNIDILIIDEVSMIDIFMMHNIFSALQKNTKIIFIGDHNQLSPIGAGSILKKIYNYSHDGYSLETISYLKKITQYSNLFNKENKNNTFLISDKICILKKNYRFKTNSGIDILFKAHQTLCVIKDGPFGIKHINKTLENIMYKKNIIKKYFYINNQIWYLGKPIIITKNNKYLNLSNGDIGITNFDQQQKLQVCFLKDNNSTKCIPVDLLENYETAWCITVHKAQGSEFNQTTLILPNTDLKILNKEILYTAVTRSRKILKQRSLSTLTTTNPLS
ncbi:RecBCD enzyme subunit RecD [Aphis craccivora]|uniref:RecBCD enzyme subunit RecD n=1 Tax=Aphis craccivora TaxID=307492 RepID=A0A6G0Y1L9_APHCR|nr:RecBCD enzyme subunit RecD [Aphis craccivora]